MRLIPPPQQTTPRRLVFYHLSYPISVSVYWCIILHTIVPKLRTFGFQSLYFTLPHLTSSSSSSTSSHISRTAPSDLRERCKFVACYFRLYVFWLLLLFASSLALFWPPVHPPYGHTTCSDHSLNHFIVIENGVPFIIVCDAKCHSLGRQTSPNGGSKHNAWVSCGSSSRVVGPSVGNVELIEVGSVSFLYPLCTQIG